MKTGIFWDERCTKHEMSRGHPESPQRLWAIKQVIDANPRLVHIEPRLASFEEVSSIHTEKLVRLVDESRGKSNTCFDPDTFSNKHTATAAFLSAGSTIALAEKVEKGEWDNGFSFARPPGHHAEHDCVMGFCFFNNIAIAAQQLIEKHHKKRIAIVDYDVHHGNGTQASFYDRDDVLFCSVHHYPFYPGTGGS
ncbi:MAG TPA: histone deacetylase, partial [bacterium]|nr:histone deacetylase [bacterium]